MKCSAEKELEKEAEAGSTLPSAAPKCDASMHDAVRVLTCIG